MHKDQKRIQDLILPAVAGRVFAETPEAERDCTLLNRLLSQGPDPLFMMETCPGEFARLCNALGIQESKGREAIEKAHEQGPGCLLLGNGIPGVRTSPVRDLPPEWKCEILWLVLASLSDCTDEGYKEEVTVRERLQRAATAMTSLALFASRTWSLTAMLEQAHRALAKFRRETKFEVVNGVPTTDQDIGFYLGYKAGHPVIAVKAGTMTFYGTIPGTTLDQHGVKVDKEISPSYGITFGEKT
jgi:hypothetical protein